MVHLTAHWNELWVFTVRAAVCPCTMHKVTPQRAHTYSEANEALGERRHLKTFVWLLDFAYVYLRTKASNHIDGNKCGISHKAKLSPHSCTPFAFIFFAASFHYSPCLCPSPESAKHGDLLEHSYLGGKRKANISYVWRQKTTPLPLRRAASQLMCMQVKWWRASFEVQLARCILHVSVGGGCLMGYHINAGGHTRKHRAQVS